MSDIDERRAAAYRKLEEVAIELSAISDSEDPSLEHNVPTAWALVIGCDYIDSDGDSGGFTALYPRDGSQARWKTNGILRQAISRIEAWSDQ